MDIKSESKAKHIGLKSFETKVACGPLANIEAHVDPEWWKHLFNSLYIKTDGDVVNDDCITKLEVDKFIEILGAEKHAKMLDVCCGQGRHSFEFFERGYNNICGLDRSSYLIAKARQRVRLNGVAIKFKEGDARKLPFTENSFDIVMILGNSFGYFELMADDVKVLHQVRRVLKPGGKLLLDVADGNFLKKHFKARSWEWINKNLFVCRERTLSASGNKLISREVVTQTNKGVIADQFYSENLYTADDLTNLLEVSGFQNVFLASAFETKSQRNQDLGMMENRLILTAVANK